MTPDGPEIDVPSLTPLERAAITHYLKTVHSEEINVDDEGIHFPDEPFYSESHCNMILFSALFASDIVHKRLKVRKTRSLLGNALKQTMRFDLGYMGEGKRYKTSLFQWIGDHVDMAFAKRCKEIADADDNAGQVD